MDLMVSRIFIIAYAIISIITCESLADSDVSGRSFQVRGTIIHKLCHISDGCDTTSKELRLIYALYVSKDGKTVFFYRDIDRKSGIRVSVGGKRKRVEGLGKVWVKSIGSRLNIFSYSKGITLEVQISPTSNSKCKVASKIIGKKRGYYLKVVKTKPKFCRVYAGNRFAG